MQDKSTYHSEQKSAGVAVAVPIMGMGQGSASASMSKSNVDSDYQSVQQQSGLKAGDDGFDIKVQGNTDLKGGLIASTDQAAQTTDQNGQPINQLTTGTLTTSDLNNKAEYEASSMSVGIGTNATAGALNPAGMGWGNDSDNQTSTTKAGISQANIKITDEEKQKELTGKDAEQTVADLNRDVSTDQDTSGKLQNKFDAIKVQSDIDAQTQITQTFGQQAAQAIGTIAQNKEKENKDQATTLREKAADPNNGLSDTERQTLIAQAQEKNDEASKWGEGGAYRVALHTVAGGLAGDVAGAAAAGTVAGGSEKLKELQGHITQSLKDAGASDNVANLASQLITQGTAAAAGAAVGAVAGNTTAGAAVGLNVDSNNRQLHPTETQWIKANAKHYADRKGISEVDAEKQLAQQAQRQVQFGTEGKWDAEASAFLGTAGKQLLPTDPAFAHSGPGYMFYATPDQKANTAMYAGQSVQHTQFAQKNDLKMPSAEQVQQAQNRDSNIRDNVKTATTVVTAAAVAATVPPTLSWCLSNPVACNRIAIAGGEITAGDALGPVGLGVIGGASAVKAVRSADEVNAAMKAKGWQPAWSPATPVIETTLQPGTKVNMIVSETEAANIRKAMQSGDFSKVKLGGWATFDNANSVPKDMRQRAAITNEFKPSSNGPFYVIELEIKKPLNTNIGFAGAQQDTVSTLRGGATQAEFLISAGEKRIDYLKPVTPPKKLSGN